MDVLWRGLEKNGMVRAWHGHGMASVNQTRQHCVNRMGKTHSKPLAARHGHGMLYVNRPLLASCQQPTLIAWSVTANWKGIGCSLT